MGRKKRVVEARVLTDPTPLRSRLFCGYSVNLAKEDLFEYLGGPKAIAPYIPFPLPGPCGKAGLHLKSDGLDAD